jgi:hypothetical protein
MREDEDMLVQDDEPQPSLIDPYCSSNSKMKTNEDVRVNYLDQRS